MMGIEEIENEESDEKYFADYWVKRLNGIYHVEWSPLRDNKTRNEVIELANFVRKVSLKKVI
jgi:hypothetical protein